MSSHVCLYRRKCKRFHMITLLFCTTITYFDITKYFLIALDITNTMNMLPLSISICTRIILEVRRLRKKTLKRKCLLQVDSFYERCALNDWPLSYFLHIVSRKLIPPKAHYGEEGGNVTKSFKTAASMK